MSVNVRHLRIRLVSAVLTAVLGLLPAGPAFASEPRAQHLPPDTLPAGKPFRVEATLLDGTQVEKVYFRFRRPGHTYFDVLMDVKEGETFEVVLPGTRMQVPGIEYYLEGLTYERERIPLFKTADDPARVFVSDAVPPGPKKGKHGLPLKK